MIFSSEILERYTIGDELGRGGTAIVYKATDRQTGVTVALKVLRPELAQSLIAERFLREVHLTQQLTHPNIVPVLGSGVNEGVFYCVLAYMEGGTLRDRLDLEKQLPLPEVCAIAREIGAALEYAHAHHVIHRDVKPENILFGGSEIRLADFGIARALEGAAGFTTSTGIVRGTPAYMSPEQASGEREYDGRSDVYSFACLLYEAIAGTPAFVGPNPQTVLAQRLIHTPRPLRVYRPTVSSELEAVLMRGLATAPADRYQSVQEFAAALCSAIERPAPVSGTSSAVSAASPVSRRVRWASAIGVMALALTYLGAGPFRERLGWTSAALLDTTRIAVFPLRQSGQEDLLFGSFQRWRGITLVDRPSVEEALSGRPPALTATDARKIAARLGAGRYVLARVDTTGAGRTLYAALYDERQGELHHVQLAFGADSLASRLFAAVADSLLLRGEPDESRDAFTPGARNLPATELMIAATRALSGWDLPAADSLLARAARLDTGSGRALLWLSQVREWAARPSQDWLPAAEEAEAKRGSLAPVEQTMASALVALGQKDYPASCQQYQSLVSANSESFAGWYGLGECHTRDSIVVPDPNARSGWRFRSSYQRGLDSYVTAFRLLPSSYRGFQGNAYARLRSLLYLSTRKLRVATTAGADHATFYAFPILERDTIEFVPVSARVMMTGREVVSPAQVGAAVVQLRQVFSRITSTWARAHPESPEAKEAIAVSLELQGDPGAIDTLRSAQRLATDRIQRMRLAADRAYIQLKLGMPDDTASLAAARRLADSLVRAPHGESVEEAELLAPMAALAGRCRATANFARAAARPLQFAPDIPHYIVAAADSILAGVALGCDSGSVMAGVGVLASRLASPNMPDSILRGVQNALFGRIVRSEFPLDSAWVSRLAQTSDYLIAAEGDVVRGHPDAAGARLLPIMNSRSRVLPGDVTPDEVLPEARLWLTIGDTANAITALQSSLMFTRNFAPMNWADPSENVMAVGSLLRASALRGMLARNDRATAERWTRGVLAVWGDADPEIQGLIRELRASKRR